MHHEADHSSHLQISQKRRRLTAGQVTHTQRHSKQPDATLLNLADLIPEPTEVLVDFSQAIWAQIALHQVQLGLLTEIPVNVEIPTETRAELDTLVAINHSPVTHVYFYIDGFKVEQGGVGAGVVCMCENDHGAFLAGCLAKSVNDANHAFEGEHAAMTWALIWAIHII